MTPPTRAHPPRHWLTRSLHVLSATNRRAARVALRWLHRAGSAESPTRPGAYAHTCDSPAQWSVTLPPNRHSRTRMRIAAAAGRRQLSASRMTAVMRKPPTIVDRLLRAPLVRNRALNLAAHASGCQCGFAPPLHIAHACTGWSAADSVTALVSDLLSRGALGLMGSRRGVTAVADGVENRTSPHAGPTVGDEEGQSTFCSPPLRVPMYVHCVGVRAHAPSDMKRVKNVRLALSTVFAV